jgi:hypothetical protein
MDSSVQVSMERDMFPRSFLLDRSRWKWAESFPTSVPIDDKWKVAIGVHPNKVHGLRKQHYQQFISLVQSRRVAAVFRKLCKPGFGNFERTSETVKDEYLVGRKKLN